MNALLTVILLAQVAGGAVTPPGTPPAPPPVIQSAVATPAPAAGAAEVAAPAGAPVAAPSVVPVPQAQAPMAQEPQQPQGGGWQMLIFFAVMILVFWLLIIRPQQKQKKKQEEFLTSLKSGDKVVTAAGFIGRIVSIDGDEVSLELAKEVRVRVVKSSIAQRQGDGETKPA